MSKALQLEHEAWRIKVGMCSIGAQGLWLRMKFLMHESPRYGYLCTVDGQKALSNEFVARRCDTASVEFESLLDELHTAGLWVRSTNGIIYDPEMVGTRR